MNVILTFCLLILVEGPNFDPGRRFQWPLVLNRSNLTPQGY